MKYLTAIFYNRTKEYDKVVYFINPHDDLHEVVAFTKQKTEEIRKEMKIKRDADIIGRTSEYGIPGYDLR